MQKPRTKDAHAIKYEMVLPDGETCKNCFAFKWCEKFFGCNPLSEACDWSPSRFQKVRSVKNHG